MGNIFMMKMKIACFVDSPRPWSIRSIIRTITSDGRKMSKIKIVQLQRRGHAWGPKNISLPEFFFFFECSQRICCVHQMALIEDHSQVRGEKERTETWDATYSKKKKNIRKKPTPLSFFLPLWCFFPSMSQEDYGAVVLRTAYFRAVALLTV